MVVTSSAAAANMSSEDASLPESREHSIAAWIFYDTYIDCNFHWIVKGAAVILHLSVVNTSRSRGDTARKKGLTECKKLRLSCRKPKGFPEWEWEPCERAHALESGRSNHVSCCAHSFPVTGPQPATEGVKRQVSSSLKPSCSLLRRSV